MSMMCDWAREALLAGGVIPAHPLALTEEGAFDPVHQRALTRYYAAAGADGIAVGVHTTQFEIREPSVGLLAPVLACARDALDEIERGGGRRLVRIAGVCGATPQACDEARLARDLGYHAGLLSLSALRDADDPQLIEHCERVGEILPLVGFYLQPAVGGRRLSVEFWRCLAALPSVVAIKMAPFNRYQTLDVVRGIAGSGRASEMALYTGNDDSIVVDLLTRFDLAEGESVRAVGGLLGHWAVWTARAVELFARVRAAAGSGASIPPDLLTLAAQVTDMNAALFDPAHDFAGCIAGIQHVLWRQGLLGSPRTLNPRESLSPNQAAELHRVRTAYPHLIDDEFVKRHRSEWV